MIHLGIAFIILVVLLVIGMPVLYCFGASLLYCAYTLGYTATGTFPTIYGKLSSVVLLSIPLFIIAGKIMEHGKIGDALVGFIEMFVGKIKGSLAVITCVACAVFGSICGSGMATLSCIGSMMMPRMKEKRYPMEIAAAVACCSAPIGMLSPPTSLCSVVAWGANLSVTACFLSTLIPGLILTALTVRIAYHKTRERIVENSVEPIIPRRHLAGITFRLAPVLVIIEVALKISDRLGERCLYEIARSYVAPQIA